MNRSVRRTWTGLVLVALLAAACGGDDQTAEPGGEPGVADNNDDGTGTTDPNDSGATLRISYRDPSRLDPHRSSSSFDNTAIFLTYDRLIHVTPDAEPVAGLATEWHFADDASYLELKLRKGVTFHDGEPFDAEAVKANLERAKNVDGSSVAGELAVVDRIEVVDAHTVRLHVNGPAAPLPLALSDRAGAMMSPAAFDDPDLDTEPVGAGMFEVVDYKPGDHITYEAYDDYWDPDAVKVASIEYLIHSETTTRLNAIRNDQVDWTYLDPSDIDQAKAADLNITTWPTLTYIHLQLDRSAKPLDNLLVRQALNHAIDREAIVDGLMNGIGVPSIQPFREGYFGFDEEIGNDYYAYDPDRARELLEEAGYGDGVQLEVLTTAGSDYADAAVAVQAHLAEVGIDLVIRSVPLEAASDTFLVQQEGDAGVFPWGGRQEPSQTLGLLFTDDGFANPGRHTTDKVMEAYQATLEIQPEKERMAAVRAASAAVTEDALDVVLFHEDMVIATNDRVTGYEGYMSGKPEFRGVGMLAE